MKNKHKFYLDICELIANQSYAKRQKSGALLEKNGNIVAFGYNGTPHGFDNVCEIGEVSKPEVLHAESNAITKCAVNGISSAGSTLYCTHSPCIDCAKIIIQAGIKKVYYRHPYRLDNGIELLYKANISCIQYDLATSA